MANFFFIKLVLFLKPKNDVHRRYVVKLIIFEITMKHGEYRIIIYRRNIQNNDHFCVFCIALIIFWFISTNLLYKHKHSLCRTDAQAFQARASLNGAFCIKRCLFHWMVTFALFRKARPGLVNSPLCCQRALVSSPRPWVGFLQRKSHDFRLW